MTLKYKNLIRLEDDQSVVDNLLRKGWELIPDEPILIEEKEEQPLSEFQQAVFNGFLVEPENFTLGLSEIDRLAFTQMLTLVQEALSLGMIDNDSIQTISDKSGQKHTITTLRFRQIMVQYGLYYKALWDQLINI